MSKREGNTLVSNVFTIDVARKTLKLLGSENLKLRQLIETNLVFEAAAARQAINHKATFASPYIAVNVIHPVQEALDVASVQ